MTQDPQIQKLLDELAKGKFSFRLVEGLTNYIKNLEENFAPNSRLIAHHSNDIEIELLHTKALYQRAVRNLENLERANQELANKGLALCESLRAMKLQIDAPTTPSATMTPTLKHHAA